VRDPFIPGTAEDPSQNKHKFCIRLDALPARGDAVARLGHPGLAKQPRILLRALGFARDVPAIA